MEKKHCSKVRICSCVSVLLQRRCSCLNTEVAYLFCGPSPTRYSITLSTVPLSLGSTGLARGGPGGCIPVKAQHACLLAARCPRPWIQIAVNRSCLQKKPAGAARLRFTVSRTSRDKSHQTCSFFIMTQEPDRTCKARPDSPLCWWAVINIIQHQEQS